MTSTPELDALFLSWWRIHQSIVHRIVRSHVAAPEDQADMAQDIAVQLWRSLPGFNGQCQPVTWIYRVALFTAMSWRRRQQARPVLDGAQSDRIDAIAGLEPRPGRSEEKEEMLNRCTRRSAACPRASARS